MKLWPFLLFASEMFQRKASILNKFYIDGYVGKGKIRRTKKDFIKEKKKRRRRKEIAEKTRKINWRLQCKR